VVLSGNQALDPAGFAPALITVTHEKDTGLNRKTCAVPKKFANTEANLNPAGTASTYSFAILPGQIDQIPLSIRA
jgi:hypothetical protein